MHVRVARVAYGWLLVTAVLHVVFDLLAPALRGVGEPGGMATLHAGLHVGFSAGQALLGTLGLWLARRAPALVREGPLALVSALAAGTWLGIAVFAMDVWPPRGNAAVFGGLVLISVLARRRRLPSGAA